MSATASRSTKIRLTSSNDAGRAALPTGDAAHYTGLSSATLKKWRVTGDGPAYVRIGSRIVYLVEDLDEWLFAHRVG
ncbi:helix-turn-helix transcriptional regulator [Brevibacterium oceani]|uniref:helix-turn-helix transcriptional regulator n=1 Tax=Brevibacterium oceani TaxID=358099 RepID=UPI0015E66A37|nr:helix-turn-helix domain-containing protein [Brevibacterium oceani]